MYLILGFLVVAISAAVIVVTMASTSVASAIMTVIVVMVMVANSIRLISQCACQQFFYSHVSRAHNAGIQLDPRFCQSHSCTAADAAANQDINTVSLQETGQSTVAAAVGENHFCANDLTFFYVVNLKTFGVSKMLEHHSICKSNCNFHFMSYLLCIKKQAENGSIVAYNIYTKSYAS